jgi:TetR/AcrR family transcriptional regulator, regulator of cefoperazone and chloramphenicol sensitivity
MDERGVQDRLLEAAEELFCLHGFKDTGVREIAAAAGCNVASINYYFGGKDKLYVEVWRRRLIAIRDARIGGIHKAMSGGSQPSLEGLLKSYAESFLEPLIEGERPGKEQRRCRFVDLMVREMVDPHLPPDMFANEMVSPVMVVLTEALEELCPWLNPTAIRYIILSVVGQLMHTIAAREMLERCQGCDLPRLDPEEMINHIVKFSAAGIRGYANGGRK